MTNLSLRISGWLRRHKHQNHNQDTHGRRSGSGDSYKKTLFDGTVETYVGGELTRSEWSAERVRKFNQTASPDAKLWGKITRTMTEKYGTVIADTGNGRYMPVWYYVQKPDGKYARMRTPSYGKSIAVAFSKLEDAKKTAESIGGKATGSSYAPMELTLEGKSIPVKEIV